MKRTILLLSAFSPLLLVPSTLFAANVAGIHRCVVAENCSVIEGACAGYFEAVNLRHENAEKEKNRQTRMRVKCDAGISKKAAPKADCVNEQCVLKKGK